MITIDMIRRGFESGELHLGTSPDPDEYETVCWIGTDDCLYLDDIDAAGTTPEGYRSITGKDVTAVAFRTLERMRASQDIFEAARYGFYETVLRKKLYPDGSEWTSVTERLPEANEWVWLVCPGEFDPPVYAGRLHHTELKGPDAGVWGINMDSDAEWEVRGWKYYKMPRPTHWMPMVRLPDMYDERFEKD